MGLCLYFRYPLQVFLLTWTSICLILRPKSKIPQPPESVLKFFFGSDRLEIMEFLSDVYSSYGLFSYEKVVYIVEPSLAKAAVEVLERPPSAFAKKGDADMTHDPNAMTREYLVPSNLERKRDAVIGLIEKTMKKMERSEVCNVSELLLKMVVDINGEILFGLDLEALDDKQEPFIDALVTIIKRTFMKQEVSPKSQEFLNAMGTFGKTIAEQVHRSLNDPKSVPCLVSHLKPCGTEATIGKLQSLFAAGNLSSASNLSLMLDLLARKLKVQEELQREADEIIDDLKCNGYRSSPKLESTMNECLRMYAPSPSVLCKASKDTPVGDFTIPAGSKVEVFLWGLQRSCCRVKNAKDFCFDRFLETSTSSCNASQSESFMPFGAGSRECTGKNVVPFVMKLMLCLFLHRFTFSLVVQTKQPKYIIDWAHGAMVHDSDVVLGVRRR